MQFINIERQHKRPDKKEMKRGKEFWGCGVKCGKKSMWIK